jgi:hypothetical protein
MLLALGLALIFRMGLAGLLLMRRGDERRTGEESAARDGRAMPYTNELA